MKKLVNTKDLSYTEWLTWRQKGIGGSDAGAVVGLNPYKSPIDVYVEKTSEEVQAKEPNEAMRLGTDLEEYVAKRWEEATGKKVRRNNFMMAHDDYPWMVANVDREVIGENAILECKTASPYSADKWKDGETPQHYVIQCLHYMAVTGAEKCYLACLIFSKGLEYRVIERDEDTINALIDIEKEFWNEYVLKNQLPPPDGSDAADECIRALYPESEASTYASLDETYISRCKRLDQITELKKELEDEEKMLKQEIQLEMKEAETAFVGNYKVTWKTTKPRETFDTKKFKAEHPELVSNYIKIGKPSRRFVIKNEAQ